MIDYDKLTDLSGVDGLSDLYITFSEIDGSPLVYPVLNVNGKRVLGQICAQGTSSGGNSKTWLQVSRLSFRNWHKYD